MLSLARIFIIITYLIINQDIGIILMKNREYYSVKIQQQIKDKIRQAVNI
jgi:hypothetical protein